MKLRLPLSLRTAVMACSVSFAILPVTSSAMDIIMSEGERKETDLKPGDNANLIKLSGSSKLTMSGDVKPVGGGTSNKISTEFDLSGDSVMKVGKAMMLGDSRGYYKLQISGNALLDVSGTLEMFMCVPDGDTKGKVNTFTINGGTVKAKTLIIGRSAVWGGVNIPGPGEDGKSGPNILTMNGGVLNIGSGGVSQSKQTKIIFTGGTLGVQDSSWSWTALLRYWDQAKPAVELSSEIFLEGTAFSINTEATQDGTGSNTTKKGDGMTITMGAVLSDNAGKTGGFRKTGAGTLILTAASTYSGGTILEKGTLEIRNDKALGLGAVALQGGTLVLGGKSVENSIEVTGNSVLDGGGAFAGILKLTSGALTGEEVRLAEGTTAVLKNGSIANVLSGKGGVKKDSDGTVLLAGINSYTGDTLVEKGVLLADNESALGSGRILMSGGTLDVAGNAAGNDMEVTGTSVLNGGESYTGTIVIKETGALTLGNSAAGNVILESGASLDTGNGMILKDAQVIDVADGASVKGDMSVVAGSTLKAGGTLDMDGVLSIDGGTFSWSDQTAMKVKGLVVGNDSGADVLGLTDGVSLVVGSSGISGRSLNMGAISLEAAADWNMSSDLVLTDGVNGLTVKTEGADETGYAVSLDGAVTGNGKLVKTGKGILALTHANDYDGDTQVRQGSLYLGDDAALGTKGKLVLSSGAALAAYKKSVNVANNMELGVIGDTSCKVYFGQQGSGDILTLGGRVNILASGVTLAVLSDTVMSGLVANNTVFTSLTKEGPGTLTFSGSLSGVQTFDLAGGGAGFTTEGALSGLKTLNMASGTMLNLGNVAGGSGLKINVAGNAELEGISGYAGAIALTGISSRLTVDGDFRAERISFKLGSKNATFIDPVNLVSGFDTAEITGTAKDSIVLDFDVDYLNNNMSSGGVFQLFSKGLTYNQGTIRNVQRQIIMLDDSQLSQTGSISWSRIRLSGKLITTQEAEDLTTYVPSSLSTYLGAAEGTVTIGRGVNYDLDDYDNYSMTAGKGTLVYQGLLGAENAGLNIADYAYITEKAEDHSTGAVILTNNANSYGKGTNVAGSTLIVDLSLDSGQDLSSARMGDNVNVGALGSGAVEAVYGTVSGSRIVLRSFGDATLDGVNTFTYGNDFYLNSSSILEQQGSNIQIVTGDIISESGENVLSNSSDKSFILKGNITQNKDGKLVLESRSVPGNLVLDGDGDNRALSSAEELLGVRGGGMVNVRNGYTVTAKGLVLNDGTMFSVDNGGVLLMGQNGAVGSGMLQINGGRLSSASSWAADVAVILGGGATNVIDTLGANVRLNRGVTGAGGFVKNGSGFLYVVNHAEGNAQGLIDVKQGRLILLGDDISRQKMAAFPEYVLNGDLMLSSGKGASLEGMIDANGHKVTFGDNTNFYLSVNEADGITGYIRNADTISFGKGTRLHIDMLDDSWVVEKSYTVFGSANGITGSDNLTVAMENEFAFVEVALDRSNDKEIGVILTRKGTVPGGTGSNTNEGSIGAVVSFLANGLLTDNTDLTGKLKQHMQKVSKMTTTEYKTYLTDMGNSASSFYTALSAQVQDATQHINSVRNRVELINPVMYDDWTQGGIYNVWAGGINHYRDVKSGSEAPGYEMTSWGGELGCAIPLSQSFMVGVGFAYTFSDVQVKDGWGSNDNDTYNVDIFARYRSEGWTITGVLTGGFTNTEYHRNQILKDELLRANSSTDGNQFLGTLEVGYDFYLNEEKSWILQPLVNITAGRAKLDSLSETGEMKNAGLLIGSQSYNMFSAGVGAKIAYQYKNSVSDQPGRVELKAMYVNDMGDVDFEVNGRFIGAPGQGFDLKGVSNERSAAIVSAGWIAPISAYGQFFVDAGCEFRKDQNGVNTTVGFSFQF